MPTLPHDATPCPSCGAPILWTVTLAQKRLPVDAEPSPKGNTAVWRDVAGRWRSRGISADRPTLEGAEALHVPHFATCHRPPPRRRPSAARARGRPPR